MDDELLKLFAWITPLLERPLPDSIPPQSREYAILTDLKAGWGKRHTADLLRGLSEKYYAPGAAVEKFLAQAIARDWKAVGEKEARPGTEIEDFIRVLWKPLRDGGDFDFTTERRGGAVIFHVTRCPVHEIAERTGLQRWMYHLACATDFYSTPAFHPKIGFTRTQTLILDGTPCNHTYFYK